MENVDIIVVGAGIWGCTVARIMAEHGFKVLVLERREDIGGNSRCKIDPGTGIEVHLYGPHIFHTDDEDVWKFVSRFTEFNRYSHKCLTVHDGKTYFMPFGLPLVNKFYDVNLTPSELPDFIKGEVEKSRQFIGDDPEANLETKAISMVGKRLYDAFISEYTRKQWGQAPSDLPASIIKRIPIRSSYDLNYYCGDRWQGIPLNGYEKMFRSMISHPNIMLEVNTDWNEWRSVISSDLSKKVRIFYSGGIDSLFDYKHGTLPWRSLRFEFETIPVADFQGTSIVNYPDADVPYTRIHEHKHFHPESKEIMSHPKTIICREHPDEWKVGKEAYYPVNGTRESYEMMKLYREEVNRIPNLTVGGRCGEYRYMDMDKTVRSAMNTANFHIFNQ